MRSYCQTEEARSLARIMHHAERFHTFDWRPAQRRSVQLDRCEATRLANAYGVDLPAAAACRGTRPRGSWAGSPQAERHGSEQCPLRATRRQLEAEGRG